MNDEVFKYSPGFEKLLNETESDFKQFHIGRETELYELLSYQRGAIGVSYTLLQEDNERLHKALKFLLQSYRADFRNITGAELNQTQAVRQAEKAINQSLIELNKSCAK